MPILADYFMSVTVPPTGIPCSVATTIRGEHRSFESSRCDSGQISRRGPQKAQISRELTIRSMPFRVASSVVLYSWIGEDPVFEERQEAPLLLHFLLHFRAPASFLSLRVVIVRAAMGLLCFTMKS